MLRKSNRISLEEATRLAILGKLPLKESTTVSTTGDGLTTVETDDANIVIEPKDNAAVEVGTPVEEICTEPICDVPAEVVEEPIADIPVDEVPVEEVPVDEIVDEIPAEEPVEEETIEDELDESKKIEEGEAPLFNKVISKHDLKKVEHKITVKENRIRKKKVETIEATETTYIDTFDELRNFCWGSAAESTLGEVERLGKEDDLMGWLESIIDGQIDATSLNDIVAYDDSLESDLGLFDYADEDEDLEENKKVEEAKEAELFSKKINKTDIKKVESKEKVEEGEAPLFDKKINETDIKKVESKEVVEEAKLEEKEEPKKHIINKVDLRKEESKDVSKDLEDNLKVKVAEGLTKFVKEAYKNGKEVKVEKVLKLTENKLYVKGSLVMENSTRDFSCKLVPVMENKTFRKYTINENKLLKITEGKTSKGKTFNLIVRK